ncbi:MAG: tetratricopeptide repeat protein [Bacteroidales bacterium]|nr:tetratricopeptide repeat protein [Bacteroidales bacterium]
MFVDFVKKSLIFLIVLCCSLSVLSQTNSEQLALQYFKNQEYEKAVELFAQLYRQTPNNHYYSFYFQTLLELKDIKEAEKLVKKQIKQFPEIQKYNVDLGYVYGLQDDAIKAKKQYETSISNITSNSVHIVELARAFQSYRLTDYIIKTYLHGRKLSNESTAYAVEIAAAYTETNDYEKAMNEYILLLNSNENMLNFVETQLINWLSKDEDNLYGEIIRTSILKAINKYPDNKAYSSLMIWFAMQKKDFLSALKQAKAMDKRYNEQGQRILALAGVAMENHDFNTAIDACKYVIEKGETNIYYNNARIRLLEIRLRQATSAYNALNNQQILALDKDMAHYFQESPLNNDNFDLYRKWISLKAVQLHNIDEAAKMIEDNLASNNIGKKEKSLLKLDLGDILQLEDDVWEATLLFSQVEKDFPNDTVGHLAKFKNAKLSFHIGEFEWAKAQLDVLRAATSKLIANDAMYFSLLISDNQNEEDSVNLPLRQFAAADFLMETHHYDEALQLFDSIEQQNAYHTLLDDILYKKAQIAMIRQQYSKADSLYAVLIASYPHDLLADEALFERAKLQEIHLKDNLKAMDLYQQLLIRHPDSIYTVEARSRFRTLRGDILKTGD